MNDITPFIENGYKEIIAEYSNRFKIYSTVAERKWLKDEYPHLFRTEGTEQLLYHMNVNIYNAELSTGICLPVALFMKSYLKDVHDVDVQIIGLFDGHVFCHCVIEHSNKYFDTFWPEGTENKEDLLYKDACTLGSVEHIVKAYKMHKGSLFLKDNLFDYVKDKLYSVHNIDDNYKSNLVPSY